MSDDGKIYDYTEWRARREGFSVYTTYDEEADAAYVHLRDANDGDGKCVDCGHGVILDLDVDGNVVGVEILAAGAAYRAWQAAGEGGRVAVREHGADLRTLADS